MKNLKYSKILELNKQLGNALKSNAYNIAVLSNITIHQIKKICEYYLRKEGINANIKMGDYDNIVQDSVKYSKSNLVIIFWELCNIIDGLQYKAELFSNGQVDAILEKAKREIDLVLENLENTSLVLFNQFTSIPFSGRTIGETNLNQLADLLNRYVEDKTPANVKLVDLEKVIANIGIKNSLDLRYYYSSKALYTIDFFKSYSNYIKPYIISANGKNKKAIIFDCDNTLWRGILGEDGFDNIEMSAKTKGGAIFSEIQSIALTLHKRGILIGLCSKNNPGDVNKVIKSHPDMQLRNEHISINKSNWSDKVTNLLDIATELNIGIESLVFVDDSSFEVNLIKQQLPQVTVIQVPERLYDYPRILRENLDLFYSLSFTVEDTQKAKMYKQQLQREGVKKKYADIEEYLASLELKVRVYVDNENIIARMSQMSQKTNQFNLTTRRYTEADIGNFVFKPASKVFAFSVVDKFGDSGVTGLCIINIEEEYMQTADIDTFLMSCRIIGRNIEYSFMDFLINYLEDMGVRNIRARFIKTPKNEQVHDFFDRCSFPIINSDSKIEEYLLDVRDYKTKDLDYIEIRNG
ncbi:MAG: HAD-IIIC family phosphatase [Calditrichales bacterium]|nr:HAD-IIIC family phosphatase [Calditrichales bacterium]